MITNIWAREILDSRGNPTVEVDLELDHSFIGTASIPSGASKGEREALELRDGDSRYHGKGVLKSIDNILNVIKPEILNKTYIQEELDKLLNELDGTFNKEKLGANSILAVSLAYLKASAVKNKKDLYQYVGNENHFPFIMMNILNGGMHADNNLCFQEFMIIPNFSTIKDNVRIGSEVFHSLKKVLKEKGLNTNVGDEGGFAPNLDSNEEAIKAIIEAIKISGYEPGKDVYLALDVAASSFYDKEKKAYQCNDKSFSSNDMIEMYVDLVNRYPIILIEDPLDENDWDGFKAMTARLKDKIVIVGDDLFVTNKKLLQYGIDNNICNAILIKANQIGTVTETIETIRLAQANNYKTIISHRSGETTDTFISDLAVGLKTDGIKTGSLSRGERVVKYNRLMKIEEQCGNREYSIIK